MRFGLGLALGRRHAASAGDSAQKSMTLTVTDSVSGTESYNYAPHSVTVEANPTGFPANSNSYGSYDALVGEIMYYVDFGDTGATFTVPQTMPSGFDDRNTAYAKKSTHVYRSSGTYTITVWAYDYLGNWATATAEVTVKADDFDATNTIVMDASNDFTGAPASNYHVTTWASLQSTMQSLKATQPIIKVYLKYGETYTSAADFYVDSYGHFIIDAWGTPANGLPVFDFTHASGTAKLFNCQQTATGQRMIKISNCRFEGQWNATTERRDDVGVTGASTTFVSMISSGSYPCDYTFDNVEVSGFGICVQTTSTATPGRITLHEVSHLNSMDYMWFDGTDGMEVSIIGTRIRQPTGALSGSYNRWSFGNNRHQHFGIRTSASMDIMMQNNDWMSDKGWNLQNTIFHQSLRFNTLGAVNTMRVFVTRNKLQTMIGAGSYNSPMNPVRLYIDYNYFITSNVHGATALGFDTVGLIARNNIIVIPSTAIAGCYLAELSNGIIVLSGANTTEAIRNEAPIILEGNTVVDLRTNAQRSGAHNGMIEYQSTTGMTITDRNNVWQAPNLTVAEDPDGPLASTSAGFEGDYPGVRRGFDIGTGTITGGDVAPSGTLFVPYANITDFSGNAVNQASYSDADGRAAIKINTSNTTTEDMAYVEEDLGADPPVEWAGSFFELNGDISVSYDATGITFTNNSTDTWPNNKPYVLHAPRGGNAMPVDTAYATPAGTAKTYAITPSSAGYEGATGTVPPFDFYGTPRRGSNHPDAVAGTPSPGALEEVAAQTGSALLETGDVVLLETADAMLLG